ncbi:aldehyde dehydrogenase [Streptomyces sp. UNOC14_S4]|nr:aldehyde dehydrogenase [Streptomyces sp. UNOC14_S4]
MELVYDSLFIGGRWVAPSASGMTSIHSASTEEPIGRVPEAAAADVDAAVLAARRAFDDPGGWARWEPGRRAAALERFAASLDSRAEEFARRVSAQNGMPITLSRVADAVCGAQLLRYYAGLLRELPVEERRPGLAGTTLVRREPVGVVAAITPWNFPQTLTFSKLAPALAAGATVVLKPSPPTLLDAFLVAEAVAEAGLPPGVVNVVPAGAEASAGLVRHPGVDKVAFTGSTAVGRAIAEECARLLRPVNLELGGKSAAIVLDDADLGSLTESLFEATLLNNGQTCYLSTRILAPRGRYRQVVDAVTDLAAGLRVGDALEEDTQVGPLATRAQRDRVEGYIARGRAEGGRVTTGGGRPKGLERGWFVEPTVFSGVGNDAAVAREEIFGPVLCVIPYEDEDDAVRLADDSPYGLAGTVWSADPERALGVARRLRTGTVGVNGYAADIVGPFGGVRNSGNGREFGPEGLASYQQPKSVYLGS